MINTVLESVGVHLPPDVLTTEEVLGNCRNSVDFPLEKFTGIRSRRTVGPEGSSLDLASRAIEDCLSRSRFRPEEIDLLFYTGISKTEAPDILHVYEPSMSLRLKARFGFDRSIALDVANACGGMFTGIAIADAFLKTGAARCALIVSGEHTTHLTRTAQQEIDGYLDPRMACLTVGDAGAAVVLESTSDDRFGFHDLELYTLGRYSGLCYARPTEREHGGAIMYTDAVRISAVGIPQGVRHALAMLRRHDWAPASLHQLLLHQASRTTIQDAMREINTLLREKICHDGNTIDNLSERGNTGSTTLFVALHDAIREGRIRSGDRVAFSPSGSGLTLGTALYTFDDLPDRIRTGLRRRAEQVPPSPFAPRRVEIASVGLAPEETPRDTFELSKAAGQRCLTAAGIEPRDVGLLVYGGLYRTNHIGEPALAAMIQKRLALNDAVEWNSEKKTFAFDVIAGANGMLAACHVASRWIEAGKTGAALVLASEVENHPRIPRGIRPSASAFLLRPSSNGKTGFESWFFRDYPEHSATASCRLRYNGAWEVPSKESRERGFVECIHDAVGRFLLREGIRIQDIAVAFPPQISPSFLRDLRGVLGERQVEIAKEGEDWFTSSPAAALDYARREDRIRSGDLGLFIGVAMGVQVACALYRF